MAAVAREDTSHAYDPAAARTTSPTIMIMVHSGPYHRVRRYRAHGCRGPEQSLETTLYQFARIGRRAGHLEGGVMRAPPRP